MQMKQLDSLIDMVKSRGQQAVVAAVIPEDESSVTALRRVAQSRLAHVIIVGDQAKAEADFSDILANGSATVVHRTDPAEAATTAVALVNSGEASLLMKGLVNTDVLLKAVLNKQTGLLDAGKVLTHITIAQIPAYERLLFFTDAAVLPCPTLEQREQQLRYLLATCRSMGVEEPRVALVHCSEKVDERHFPVTTQYREIAERAGNGEFGSCIVDGPLDVKTACNLHAAQVKHIASPIAGAADALIFPDIESGNVFYKTITLFAGATTAGMLAGARVPVVVPSRGDDAPTKLYSLLAAICASTV